MENKKKLHYYGKLFHKYGWYWIIGAALGAFKYNKENKDAVYFGIRWWNPFSWLLLMFYFVYVWLAYALIYSVFEAWSTITQGCLQTYVFKDKEDKE